jgi:hypothetical protein
MKYKIPQYVILMVLLTILGCEKIDLNESFVCKVGDKIRVRSNLSFTIKSVYDWRCPIDVMCVSSGDVDISLRFHQGFQRVDTVLCLLSKGKNPIDIGGYSFKLLKVEPPAEINKTIPQDDFRIEMIILKD